MSTFDCQTTELCTSDLRSTLQVGKVPLLEGNACLPKTTALPYLAHCVAGGLSTDRLAARAALEELAVFGPSRSWRLIEVNPTHEYIASQR